MAAEASATAAARPALYPETHVDPQGPGDARPTAMQIVKDEGLLGDKLAGRVFLVTGCSSGIGVETARALHATGADVYVTARDEQKASEVLADIRKSNAESKGKLELVLMELDKLDSVRAGAADFLKRSGGKLNVLVCNAGIMAPPYGKTVDGFETQIGVNHLAHFLLFDLVKGALLSSATAESPSRVVMVSSLGHRRSTVRLDDLHFEKGDYQPFNGYGQAKTANIWMANEIERRYGSKNLHATSLMPGAIWTDLQRFLTASAVAQRQTPEAKKRFKSVEQGAATTVWAAVGKEWSHKGGKYLEDCAEAGPAADNTTLTGPGYASWAYDEEGAKKLWEMSRTLVGLGDE